MIKFALVALFFLLAACGAGEVIEPSTTRPATSATSTTTPALTSTTNVAATTTTPPVTSTTKAATTTSGETQVPTTGSDFDPELSGVIDRARMDLVDRLGVDASAIEVISAESVTWPDGALGCPEPGMFYTQALVDGSRVALGHEGAVYHYHAGADEEPFLCESPSG